MSTYAVNVVTSEQNTVLVAGEDRLPDTENLDIGVVRVSKVLEENGIRWTVVDGVLLGDGCDFVGVADKGQQLHQPVNNVTHAKACWSIRLSVELQDSWIVTSWTGAAISLLKKETGEAMAEPASSAMRVAEESILSSL